MNNSQKPRTSKIAEVKAHGNSLTCYIKKKRGVLVSSWQLYTVICEPFWILFFFISWYIVLFFFSHFYSKLSTWSKKTLEKADLEGSRVGISLLKEALPRDLAFDKDTVLKSGATHHLSSILMLKREELLQRSASFWRRRLKEEKWTWKRVHWSAKGQFQDVCFCSWGGQKTGERSNWVNVTTFLLGIMVVHFFHEECKDLIQWKHTSVYFTFMC